MCVENAMAAHQKATEEVLQATLRLRKAQQAATDAAGRLDLKKLARPPPRNPVKPPIL
jgi:hypothetical protein